MKLNTKTITLTGTEQEIKLSGQNCDIRNDGTDTVYASGEPNITAGADGVMSIPSGQAAKLLGCNGTLYLLGTGSVQLCGNDYAEQVFKCAPAGGGSGTTDQTARDTINAHANNTDIHLTAEKAIEAAATSISNPNLLINSDFKINQRGQTEYVGGGYCVDRWNISSSLTAVVGEHLTIKRNTVGGYPQMYQCSEITPHEGDIYTASMRYRSTKGTYRLRLSYLAADYTELGGSRTDVLVADGEWHTAAISVEAHAGAVMMKTWLHDLGGDNSTLDDSIEIEYIKLEKGAIATPFIPSDSATELLKCQRYFVRLDNDSARNYSYNGSGFVTDATHVQVVCCLPAPMRLAEPTITMSEVPCTIYTASKGIRNLYETIGIAAASAIAANGVALYFTIADGVTGDPAQLVFKNNAGQYLDISAEL